MARLAKASNVTAAEKKHCAGRTFLLDYMYPGQSPEVKRQIIDMALNASTAFRKFLISYAASRR